MTAAHQSRRDRAGARGASYFALIAALTSAGCSDAKTDVGADAGADVTLAGICADDDDCSALDDGDPCNGVIRCDPATGRCHFDPESVVRCDDSADTACTANRCEAEDGVCKQRPRGDGLPCDDGDACTLGDTCEAGACVTGAVDLCGCRKHSDCKDDGDICNGVPGCDLAHFPYACKVVASTVVNCKEDGDPCVEVSCTPDTGKCDPHPVADGAPCNDGDACTSDDSCSGGTCAGGVDTCACTKTADCADADANLCTGVPYCAKPEGAGADDPGVCKTNPATIVSCSGKSDTQCAKNQCVPSTGGCVISAVNDDQSCDDGDPCTKGEVCVAGSCAAGVDTCKCTSVADCADQEDGDACNGTLFCNQQTGACEVNPASVVTCPTVADSDCAKNVCIPATGACEVLAREEVKLVACADVDFGGLIGKQCLWAKAGEKGKGPFPCEDGSSCTDGDHCEGKSCKAGTTVCQCAKDSDCLAQDDGDLCNGTPYCDKATGQCKDNPVVVFCDKKDDSDCLKASCNPKTGGCSLQPVAVGSSCDDGKVCTVDEACDAKGACSGVANACDDGEACTIDVCVAGVGCKHKPLVCDDGNLCTDEGCDAKTGKCSVAKAAATTVQCDADGSGCTVADHCDGKGACVAGETAACGEAKEACKKQICKSKSASSFECVLATEPDGTACDDGDPCFIDEKCLKGKCQTSTTTSLWVGKPPGVPLGRTYASAIVRASGETVMLQSLGGASPGWQLTKIATAGAVSATETLKTAAGVVAGTAVKLLDLDASGLLIVGHVDKGQGASTALAFLPEGAKLPTWQLPPAPGKGATVCHDAVLDGAGNVVVAESSTGTIGSLHVIRQLGSDGTELWKTAVAASLPSIESARLAAAPEGGVAAHFTSAADKSGAKHVAALLQGSGDIAWQIAPAKPKPWRGAVGMFFFGDGAITAMQPGVDAGAYWRSVSLQSASPSAHSHALEDDFLPTAAAQAGAYVYAVGLKGNGGVLALYDRHGNRQWMRSLATVAALVPREVIPDLARQRVIVAFATAQTPTTKTQVVYLRAVTALGALTCASRGACADKKLGDCDDDNACTADACSPLTGCVHTQPAAALCALETGCSAIGVCAQGKCGEPTYGRLFVHAQAATGAAAPGAAGLVTAVADKPSGHGWLTTPTQQGVEIEAYRLDLDDGSVAEHSNVKVSCEGLHSVDDLIRRPNGDVLFIGRAKVKGNDDVAALCAATGLGAAAGGKATINGTLTLLADSGCPSCAQQSRAIGLHDNGDVLVAVESEKKGDSAQIWRLDKDLKILQGKTLKNAAGLSLNGICAAPSGELVAVGRQGKSGTNALPLFVSRGPDTKNVSTVTIDSLVGGELFAVTPSSSGHAIAVGMQTHSSAARSSLAASLTVTGKLLWSHVPKVPDQGALVGVVATEDGYVAVGTRIVGGPRALLLVRRTASGAELWSRTHVLAGNKDVVVTPGSLVRSSEGGFLFGARLVDGDKDGLWVHASGHGFMSCADAGLCTAATTSCDDKNPCTADWCHSTLGCQQTKISAIACGAGGTCDQGVCVSP